VYSIYYRARLVKAGIWFLTGSLRSAEGYVLERTLEGTSDVVEFFVTPSYVEEFESLMVMFRGRKIIVWFAKMPNRIECEMDLSE
jgi:hypothetical protein